MRTLVVFFAIVALLAMSADAYKSVRHRRPETDAERAEHEAFHRRMPEPETHGVDEHLPKEPHWHRSKSYHRQYGPREHHDSRIEPDRPPHRYDNQGHEIPEFVHHDDNPNHDRSRIHI
mmetsp:Transcript_4900/g.15509  ORF Transcript_4900/g.15509 Transcript_4900/m.15509 type:complete len:119 (-) Transcript_4900:430-786(-)